MTKEEAIKVIRHMAYLSAHVVENGVEAYEYIEQFLSKPSLPSNLNDAEFEYAQSLDEIPANQEEEKMIYDAFKAGAEWRDAQIPKLPNSIDEAAEKYAIQGHENHTNVNYINTYIEGKRIGFKAGAEWMVQQGETIDGEVLPLGLWLRGYTNPKTSYPLGTKVTVQIRKKEE